MAKEEERFLSDVLLKYVLEYGELFQQQTWHVGMTARAKVIALDAMFLHSHLDDKDTPKTDSTDALFSLISQTCAVVAEACERGDLTIDQIKAAFLRHNETPWLRKENQD